MYGWIWRHLPGPAVVRLLLMLAAAAAIVFLLFEYAFPWLAQELHLNETTVGDGS